jgi:hypothetical protein
MAMSTLNFSEDYVRKSPTQGRVSAMRVAIPAFIFVAALVAADLYASKGTYSIASMAALGRVVRYAFL